MHISVSSLLACAGLVAALPASDTPAPGKVPGRSTCGKPLSVVGERQKLHYVDLTMEGEVVPNRRYAYWLPQNYDPSQPAPVIFALHGGAQSIELQFGLDHFSYPEFGDGQTIIVYPESSATELFNHNHMWSISPLIKAKGIDDIKYILAVLDHIQESLCINERKVYVTGMSQGGGLTNELACDPVASTKFAAFAPVAGSFWYSPLNGKKGAENCHPKTDPIVCNPGRRPVPILATHGGGDPLINYGGGYLAKHESCFPDYKHWLHTWAEFNQIDPDDIRHVRYNYDNKSLPGRKSLGGDAERQIYGLNDDPRGLLTHIYAGSKHKHDWPRTFVDSQPGGGYATFNLSNILMDWFHQWQLPDADGTIHSSERPVQGQVANAKIEYESVTISHVSTVTAVSTATVTQVTTSILTVQAPAETDVDAAAAAAKVEDEPVHATDRSGSSWSFRIWPSLVAIFTDSIGSMFGWP